MCNAEWMTGVAIGKKSLEEGAKSEERKAIQGAYGLALSAEGLRRSEEEASVIEWSDTEMRKINSALGASLVVSAAAGVHIPVIGQQWAAAVSQLYGARSAVRRKQAAAGDLRELDIDSVKRHRLAKNKPAGAIEWALDLSSAFMQGAHMEHKMFGTLDNTFGIDVSSWFDYAKIDVDKQKGSN